MGCRHTWDSPVCTNNRTKAELKPGGVHKQHSCRAGRGTAGGRSSSSRCAGCAGARGEPTWASGADRPVVLPLFFPHALEFLSPKAASHRATACLSERGAETGMLRGVEESRHCTHRQHRFSRERCDITDSSPALAARVRSRCGAGGAGSLPGPVLPAAGVLRGCRKTGQPKSR